MTKCVDGSPNQVFNIVFFCHVGRYKYGFAAGITELPGSLFTSISGNVCYDNACALTCKQSGCCLSHTARRACDNRYFVFESHGVLILLLTCLSEAKGLAQW